MHCLLDGMITPLSKIDEESFLFSCEASSYDVPNFKRENSYGMMFAWGQPAPSACR